MVNGCFDLDVFVVGVGILGWVEFDFVIFVIYFLCLLTESFVDFL